MTPGDFGVLSVVAVAVSAAAIFSLLVSRRARAEKFWSNIEAQLKRRAELIPQFVSAVKGYAAHERSLFVEIAHKRSAALAAADNIAARAAAEAALSAPVSQILLLSETYPELKASDSFLDLQRQLAETEQKIGAARTAYNRAVRALNASVEKFPSKLIARPLGFRQRAFFGSDGAG